MALSCYFVCIDFRAMRAAASYTSSGHPRKARIRAAGAEGVSRTWQKALRAARRGARVGGQSPQVRTLSSLFEDPSARRKKNTYRVPRFLLSCGIGAACSGGRGVPRVWHVAKDASVDTSCFATMTVNHGRGNLHPLPACGTASGCFTRAGQPWPCFSFRIANVHTRRFAYAPG